MAISAWRVPWANSCRPCGGRVSRGVGDRAEPHLERYGPGPVADTKVWVMELVGTAEEVAEQASERASELATDVVEGAGEAGRSGRESRRPGGRRHRRQLAARAWPAGDDLDADHDPRRRPWWWRPSRPGRRRSRVGRWPARPTPSPAACPNRRGGRRARG